MQFHNFITFLSIEISKAHSPESGISASKDHACVFKRGGEAGEGLGSRRILGRLAEEVAAPRGASRLGLGIPFGRGLCHSEPLGAESLA